MPDSDSFTSGTQIYYHMFISFGAAAAPARNERLEEQSLCVLLCLAKGGRAGEGGGGERGHVCFFSASRYGTGYLILKNK